MKKVSLYSIPLIIALIVLSCQKPSHEQHSNRASHVASDSDDLAMPVESTNRKVISSQTVVKPERQAQSNPVDAYGFISLDERRSNQVAARVGGRIETLYVKYENQYVRKGDKILDLYSVDLNTYQEELIYAQEIDPDGELPKHAAHKLKLLGATDAQIKNILQSGKTSFTLAIYSPYSGYIFYDPSPKGAAPQSAMASSSKADKMSGAMSAGSPEKPMSSAPMGSQGSIREGAYVLPGQTLFWINDLREVWGILSVDNLHQERISLNDSVEVFSELMPGEPYHTRIEFIEPQYISGQKFIQVRVYLPNKEMNLRVNSLLEATVHPKAGEVLTLPASSMLYLGGRQAVWKKTGETNNGSHIFEIQFVNLGPVSQGRVAVLDGLSGDDEVALDAGFLIDRESLVKPE